MNADNADNAPHKIMVLYVIKKIYWLFDEVFGKKNLIWNWFIFSRICWWDQEFVDEVNAVQILPLKSEYNAVIGWALKPIRKNKRKTYSKQRVFSNYRRLERLSMFLPTWNAYQKEGFSIVSCVQI